MTILPLADNPFSPAAGSVPDHLVGREQEQVLLKRTLAAIDSPRERQNGPLHGRAPQPLRIIGSRGAGKTALLAWTESKALAMGVDVVRLAHLPNVKSGNAFSEFLAELAKIPDLNWKQQIAVQKHKYIQMALNWKSRQPHIKVFKEVLEVRLRIRPLLLLLDEVMHYDVEMLSKLLQQSQILASARWPLALVLAGTPALEGHLDEVDANFISRTKNIYINRLDSAATRKALNEPFAARNVTVQDEALELMAGWTDNYPYFIQIVGSEIWEAKEDGGTEVDLALVQNVEEAVHEQRNDFYRTIYRKISNAELLEHAMRAVAAIEAAPSPLTPKQVCASLDTKDTLDVYNQLLDAGLFWERSNRRVYAAIPSFFNYFKEEYEQDHS